MASESNVFVILRQALTWVLKIAVMLAVFGLVIDVCYGVWTRYIDGEQAKWTEELARFLLIWVSLLGGALAFEEKAHLGVDFVVGKLDLSARRASTVVAQILVLAFAAILIWGGYQLVMENLQVDQLTPALGWKMGYVYLAVPIAGLFAAFFTLERIYELLTGRESVEDQIVDEED